MATVNGLKHLAGIPMSIKRAVWRAVSRHRSRASLRLVARLSSSYLDAYHSRGAYRIDDDGEQRVLDLVGPGASGTVIDAGANIGHWTAAALSAFPASQIVSFEPVPSTVEALRRRLGSNPRVRIEGLALSDGASVLHMSVPRAESPLSTIASSPDETMVQVRSTTIDDYCDVHVIKRIAFLKIDTEGHDHRVLQGARGHLAAGRIDVIQFEYGPWAIDTRFLLCDFYALLEAAGFAVGKIHPRTVEFGPYRAELEDFRGLNYLAVRREQQELIDRLQAAR